MSGLILSSTVHAKNLGEPTWVDELYRSSLYFMQSNISTPDAAPGTVMASDQAVNPPYRFHWKRDAALTMAAYFSYLYENETDANKRQIYAAELWKYVRQSRKFQRLDTQSRLGEPKFNKDGSAFNEAWGRPQNDGPALEALTLIEFLRSLEKDGAPRNQIDELYFPEIPAHTIIKANLEYVAYEWTAPSFDLWEEKLGRHFYTLLVQRRALKEGAAVAAATGDRAASEFYKQKVIGLSDELLSHWDSERNYILSAKVPFPDRESAIDISVILGVLHAQGSDRFFSASDDRVLATALKIEETFADIYPLNKNRSDGFLIGRYPKDKYFDGHPWLLANNAMAELFYRAVEEWNHDQRIVCTEINLPFLKSLGVEDGESIVQGKIISRGSNLYRQLTDRLLHKADAYLRLSFEYRNEDGSLTEQVHRETGKPVWVGNLTWSCASAVTAIGARRALVSSAFGR